ncbi:RDD family protein [Streptomyces mexicanus]|uniref:RDD family protein n=1 Tax=Streptomyces mexicanus TaxID=178566 RepID=UPI003658D4DA
MSELVTGEAVALELRPARLPSRALAVVLDLAVAVAAYVVVTLALVVATASLDEAARVAVSIATFLLVLVGGPIAVETLSHGRSLGKLACGLRVVRDDGGPIRFRHALVRGAIGVVEILMTFGVVACIASLVSARGRRLGDVFAGTLVVRERVASGQAALAPPPPPWLAGQFSALDLSAVPDGLWLAVRQYLTRMGQLDPQVGWGMAQRLADDLAARTGAPVPPETPPAMYLAAVLQERQAREARRAFGSGAPAGAPAAQHSGAVRAPGGVPAAPAVPSSTPSPAAAPAITMPSVSTSPAPTPSVTASAAPASAVSGPSAPSASGSPASAGDASRAERPATGFVPPA